MFWMNDKSNLLLNDLGETDKKINGKKLIDWYWERIKERIEKSRGAWKTWETKCPSLMQNIEKIVKAPADKLLNHNASLKAKLKRLSLDINDASSVFNYTSYLGTNYDIAHKLAKYLDCNVCVYCGRIYTNTVIKKGKCIIHPTFDHFFPKNDYPLLALSFFNLIPSCYNCNCTTKGQNPVNSNTTYLHPYINSVDEINSCFKFSYRLGSSANNHDRIKIKIRGKRKDKTGADVSTKVNNSTSDFFIEDVYQVHNSYELKEMLDNRNRFSPQRIKDILNKNLMSEDELYELILGTEIGLDDKEELNRPLFKLKNDLAREIFPAEYLYLKKNRKV